MAVVDMLVEGGDIDQLGIDEHTRRKVRNLYSAISFVGRGDWTVEDVLTENFIKHVHSLLAEDNVIVNGGQYRTQLIRARGSSVNYCVPNLIEERLKTLLAFVQRKHAEAPVAAATITTEVDRLLYMLHVGTLPVSEFLLIHPFGNGNGRTARILLNAFLKSEVVVPFSLYVHSREQYIEALEAPERPVSSVGSGVIHAARMQ